MSNEERRVLESVAIAFLTGFGVIFLATRQQPSWIDAPRLVELLEQGAVLVDTRPAVAYESRTLPGAISIPTRDLAAHADRLPHYSPIVVFGFAGDDSVEAYRWLRQHGFEAYDLGPMNRYPQILLVPHHHHHEHSGAGEE